MKFPFFSSIQPAAPKRSRRAAPFTPLDFTITGRPSARGPDTAPPEVDDEPWPHEPEFNDVPPPGTIGAILVDARRISIADARRIVATQVESRAPFGEIAVQLGLATRDDITFALSRQFAMPCLQEGDDAIDPEVIAAFHPGHELVERLRNLRGQIALRALDATPPLRSLAVMGTERGVGRSFIAANLATVFAQLGARTLLVDADLMRPRQHTLFRLNNRTGLSSILAGRAKLNAVVPVPGVPGFAVLPSGPLPPNPDDLIARPTLSHFLRRCEHDFDVIVLDTPAWRDGSSARMIAAAAGAAVLLVQEGKTAATDASEVGQELENVSAKLLGVVLNRP
jgi:chain length determinant protein tyrosine kinase EpsG